MQRGKKYSFIGRRSETVVSLLQTLGSLTLRENAIGNIGARVLADGLRENKVIVVHVPPS